ncbi:MAG: DUF559 domain-containing protein [Calditrichaeota bacterium]|nr:DUF559 domain-containing protein [Calditrichota bacterium]
MIRNGRNKTFFRKRSEFDYRPFDTLSFIGLLTSRPAWETMKHFLARRNIGLVFVRQVAEDDFNHIMTTRNLIDNRFTRSNKGIASSVPLYVIDEENTAEEKFKPNLDAKFVKEFGEKLGLTFVEEGSFWSPSVYGGVRGGLESGAKAGLNWKSIPKTHWQFANEMRKDPSAAEKKLWLALKSDKLGVTFRRQHPIGPFIADFYCSALQLVIEVDGDTHASDEAVSYDLARDEHMRSLGLTVLRFSNSAVLKGLDGVLESIGKCIQTPPTPPVNGGELRPSPVNGGIRRGSRGTDGGLFGPEDVFYYIYAIFHAPTYRERYKEFLKIDFPRVPLTSDVKLFANLVPLGHELAQYHLLEHPSLHDTPIRFPEPGDNLCEKIRYDEQHGRVYINKTQYFETIPQEVWEFHIGGYQVCEKWLKDRAKAKRTLTLDDLKHYEKTVMALGETIRLMKEIDAAIPEWPIK